MVGNVEPDPQRFYAFVDFADETDPDVYIVPICIVRDAAERAHREYHRVHPGAGPSGIRKIQDPYPYPLKVPGYDEGWLKTYRDGWAQLGPGANSLRALHRHVRRELRRHRLVHTTPQWLADRLARLMASQQAH